MDNTKFCKFCGEKISNDAVICVKCGRQIEELKKAPEPVIVNNNNYNNNNTSSTGTPKNKIVALLLCFFLGFLGAHKFYEGKVGLGILYLFTAGLFGIGALIDFIVLIFKPETYYV